MPAADIRLAVAPLRIRAVIARLAPGAQPGRTVTSQGTRKVFEAGLAPQQGSLRKDAAQHHGAARSQRVRYPGGRSLGAKGEPVSVFLDFGISGDEFVVVEILHDACWVWACQGETGLPSNDAAARELRRVGRRYCRVRRFSRDGGN